MKSQSGFRTTAAVSGVVILSLTAFLGYAFIRMAGYQIHFGQNGLPELERTGTSSYFTITYPGVSASYRDKTKLLSAKAKERPLDLMLHPQELQSIEAVLVTDGERLKLNQVTVEDFRSWKGSKQFDERASGNYSGIGAIFRFDKDGRMESVLCEPHPLLQISLSKAGGAEVTWPFTSEEMKLALGPPESEKHGRKAPGAP
jgi:hypothetical protein